MFFVYRLAIALILVDLFFFGGRYWTLGAAAPALFALVSLLYLGFVLAGGLFVHWHTPAAQRQVQWALWIDIAALTLLMHASGGVSSGLALLIAVSLTGGSLLMAGRLALLHASLATLAVLAEQLFAWWRGEAQFLAFPQAGLLGVTFFAVALLAHGLARRIQEGERLAARQKLDLANLGALNDYIIQHMNTGVLVVDGEGVIRHLNLTAWRLLGMPRAERGAPLKSVSPPIAEMLRQWRRDPTRRPAIYRPQTGGPEIKPGFMPLGGAGGATLVFLEDNARVAEQAQQMKLASLGRLTASIAHEIRNPLGAIGHAAQLLAESDALDSGDRRLIEIIGDNTRRVNEIVETVLGLSRRSRARPEFLPLAAWCAAFVREFADLHPQAPEAPTVEIAPPRLEVQADPRQLRQVLEILCDNAVSHAGPDVRIQLAGGLSRESPYPYLDVLDDGPGIPPGKARQIFEPFFTTRNQGTGLGLYIARELCEINWIGLEYMPVPSGGSCFHLRFRNWRLAGKDERGGPT